MATLENIRHIAIEACSASGVYSYYSLPADQIRSFCDGIFPLLAKSKQADIMAGYMHRWRGGHDLIIDVARTAQREGFAPAARQSGHILLTDFPTKDGIPIPGFSNSGLGKHLVELGIPKGWLCVNAVDAGIGVLAVAEGFGDLKDALAGQLQMDSVWTAFDTFGEGGIELAVAIGTKNPILLASAAENLLAGVVAIRNSVRAVINPLWYIDPVQFFGSCLSSAVFGYVLGRYVAGQTFDQSFASAMKSGAVSAFFLLSPWVSYGIMAAFAAGEFVKISARHDLEEARRTMQWDFASVCSFLASAEAAHEGFEKWYSEGLTGIGQAFLEGDMPMLESSPSKLEGDAVVLDGVLSVFDGEMPILEHDALIAF